ncbi:MAG: hypothetical protein SV062_01165, partial [Thermodesulfobacteriota bacterium]|nr:hypothetical protein [Thermodesulfobacteriota bacterium]
MVKFFNKLFSILDENVLLLITIICTLHYIENKSVYAFSPEKAEFSIKFKNEISPYRVMGVFVLPGEIITLEAVNSDKS